MNLPNAITVGRIAASPVVALLPFSSSWVLRLIAFGLFLLLAVSDYVDGSLARSRNLVTDLGKLLDPLADKFFLVATFVPMYTLMEVARGRLLTSDPAVLAATPDFVVEHAFPFVTPWFVVGLPVWIVAVVLGREVVMTLFRQFASRRGVVIAAIASAKTKTVMQLIWVGAAYFWFAASTAAFTFGWRGTTWTLFAYANGIIGVAAMTAAVVLTFYSLGVYLWRYGHVFTARAPHTRS